MEWFNGDVKELIDEATSTGGDPTPSDAFALNGQPGFPNNCSNGTNIFQPCILYDKMKSLSGQSHKISIDRTYFTIFFEKVYKFFFFFFSHNIHITLHPSLIFYYEKC